jgi:hypothetical protein
MFARARRRFLSWARWIQCIPFHPVSLRSIRIFSHRRLCLPSVLFPSIFHTLIFSPVRVNTTPAPHLLVPVLIILIPFDIYYKSWRHSLCSFFNLLLFSLSSAKVFHWAFCFQMPFVYVIFFNMRDYCSHSYKTTGKIVVYYNYTRSFTYQTARQGIPIETAVENFRELLTRTWWTWSVSNKGNLALI